MKEFSGIGIVILAALAFWARPDGQVLIHEMAQRKLLVEKGCTPGHSAWISQRELSYTEAAIAEHSTCGDAFVATFATYRPTDGDKSMWCIGVFGHAFVF